MTIDLMMNDIYLLNVNSVTLIIGRSGLRSSWLEIKMNKTNKLISINELYKIKKILHRVAINDSNTVHDVEDNSTIEWKRSCQRPRNHKSGSAVRNDWCYRQ